MQWKGVGSFICDEDIYMIRFSKNPEAGAYDFVWIKNMELKEFSVFAFGIDWKNSN